MAKPATSYECQQCQATSARWLGRCPRCQEFGSMTPVAAAPGGGGPRRRSTGSGPPRPAQPISLVAAQRTARIRTGATEFDRVLGGGMVAGQVVLVAGEPGVGKSTLMLSVAERFAATSGTTALYVAGEESAEQVGVRAQRIGAADDRLLVADETDLGTVLDHIESQRPGLVVVDSVQTLSSTDVDGRAGGISQVSEVAGVLTRQAKARGMPILLVGQSTKENSVAGPRSLEHVVDTLLTFDGDAHTPVRLLRAVKNRYGPADEVVCYEQTDTGLAELADPSNLFRLSRDRDVSGTCPTITLEGRRALSAEIQALVSPPAGSHPARVVTGFDRTRAALLTAVTLREAQLHMHTQDLFLATVAGLRITDPAADLAVCLALFSAMTGRALPPGVIAFGEVALSGDIRPAPALRQRLAEANRLGYRVAMVPVSHDSTDTPLHLVRVTDLRTAMLACRNLGMPQPADRSQLELTVV